MNALVVSSHICVTITYTITQTIIFYYKDLLQDYRMLSAFYFFAGSADLFLSVTLWFIFDDKRMLAVVIDGDRVYTVTAVIKVK